jgi:hypothetical protein
MDIYKTIENHKTLEKIIKSGVILRWISHELNMQRDYDIFNDIKQEVEDMEQGLNDLTVYEGRNLFFSIYNSEFICCRVKHELFKLKVPEYVISQYSVYSRIESVDGFRSNYLVFCRDIVESYLEQTLNAKYYVDASIVAKNMKIRALIEEFINRDKPEK